MIALGTGAIIFDGLSQTQIYFDLFGNVDLFGLPVVRDTMIAGSVPGRPGGARRSRSRDG